MVRERLASYRDRVRRKLGAAFREGHTPHQVAASFAIGVFVTALPTGGLGVGLFFVLVSLRAWISKPAIFASVAVLNPIVKPAVYLSSFRLGPCCWDPTPWALETRWRARRRGSRSGNSSSETPSSRSCLPPSDI